jgi:hypothetical protein
VPLRRRTLLVGGALAALVCAGIAAWLSRRPMHDALPSATESGDGAGDDAPALAANDAEAAQGYRLEGQVAVPRGRVSDATGRGVLVVRVVDGEERPVPGLTVTPSGAWRPAGEPAPPSRRSDEAGVARWTGLREGDPVHVSAWGEGWSTGMAYAVVGGPRVVVRSDRLARHRVRVLDDAGVGIAKAEVVLYAPPAPGEERALPFGRMRSDRAWPFAEWIAHAKSDAEGLAPIDLPPGSARGRLWVRADGYATWVDLDWVARDTEVRLERAREIEGLVRDTTGAVLPDGYVRWETAQGLVGEEAVAYDGTFTIGGLPSSPVRLEWRLAEARALDGRNVLRATAGTGRVTFAVALGASLTVRVEGWPREPGGVARLTPEGGTRLDENAVLRGEIDLDGVVRFQGLEPDRRYVFWVPPRFGLPWEPQRESRTSTAYRRDVVASEEVLVVPLTTGRTVRGVVDLAGTDATGPVGREGPWRFLSVTVEGPGLEARGSTPPPFDATDAHEIPFRVDGVPEGSFLLRATLQVDDREGPRSRWVGEAPVPATEEPIRVRLRPAPLQTDER